MTTRERLTPEGVAALSDEELSVRVVRDVLREWISNAAEREWAFASWSQEGTIWWRPNGPRDEAQPFSPSNPVAVDHVREHMRERWKDAAKRDGISRHWKEESGESDVRPWVVSVWRRGPLPHANSRVCKASGTYGRAIFEAALLSAQEMDR